MYIYTDLLTGDELLNDTFPREKLFNGMIWKVESELIPKYKEVDVNTGGNDSIHERNKKNQKRAYQRSSKHGTTSSQSQEKHEERVVNIIDHFGLVEVKNLFSDKKEFAAHIKEYLKKIYPELDEEQQILLKNNHLEAGKFLRSKFEDLQFFVGSSGGDNPLLVFAYYDEEQEKKFAAHIKKYISQISPGLYEKQLNFLKENMEDGGNKVSTL